MLSCSNVRKLRSLLVLRHVLTISRSRSYRVKVKVTGAHVCVSECINCQLISKHLTSPSTTLRVNTIEAINGNLSVLITRAARCPCKYAQYDFHSTESAHTLDVQLPRTAVVNFRCFTVCEHFRSRGEKATRWRTWECRGLSARSSYVTNYSH